MKNLFARLQNVIRKSPASGILPKAGGGKFRRSLDLLSESPLWARRRWLQFFGWPGAAGAGLLAMCMALYLSTIQPAQMRLNEAHENADSIQERVKRAANGLNRSELTQAEQLAEFYQIFPNEKTLLPWLEKIFTLAQSQGINLDQGEYKVTHDRVGRLMRFQMTLPIKSEYPQIRKYLNSLRAEIPIISMEHLQFERQKVDDPVVEAKIKLALYLGHEP